VKYQEFATLLERIEDGPLNRAHIRKVAKRERFMMCDLRLRNYSWSNAAMRPGRTMHDEGMADVHVTCVTGCHLARPLERRGRQVSCGVSEESAGFAIRREKAWNIHMRSCDNLGWRIILTDIREKEQ
jgi:hypothetical protein